MASKIPPLNRDCLENVLHRLPDIDRVRAREVDKEWKVVSDEVGLKSLFARDILDAARKSDAGAATEYNLLRAFRDFAENRSAPTGERARQLDLSDDEYLSLRKDFSLQGFPWSMRGLAMAYPGLIPEVCLPPDRGRSHRLDDLDLEDFAPSVFLGQTHDGRKFLGMKVQCDVDYIGQNFQLSDPHLFFVHQKYLNDQDVVVATGHNFDRDKKFLGPEGDGDLVTFKAHVYHGNENYLLSLQTLFREGAFSYRTNFSAARDVSLRLL